MLTVFPAASILERRMFFTATSVHFSGSMRLCWSIAQESAPGKRRHCRVTGRTWLWYKTYHAMPVGLGGCAVRG